MTDIDNLIDLFRSVQREDVTDDRDVLLTQDDIALVISALESLRDADTVEGGGDPTDG